jgi:sulfite exporter TauE/SafE/copper chaperone CopZ
MKFYVQGMHCPSCVMLTEGELGDLPQVKQVKADLATKSVEVEGDFGSQTPVAIAQELTKPLAQYGYALTLEPAKAPVQWKDFYIAAPMALGFIIVFILLQKLGIVNWVETGTVTYGTAFIIGLIASVSTCMAVVGGLVLSMSATFSKADSGYKPQVMFHLGRLTAFYVLGGVIGVIGSQFQLSTTVTFVLSLAVGIVLLILGINLLDIFPWAKKLQITMPKRISQTLLNVKSVNTALTPLLVGAVTFFLPCGFTQSMQLYTLTTGSFTTGGLTMLSFALGTLPMLALLSFSSVGLKTPKSRSIFFKAAGGVVVFFAVINILGSLVAIGLIPPILNF